MRYAETSLFPENTFGRVNVLAPELGILQLVAGGNVDVMLSHELVVSSRCGTDVC